MSVVANDGSRQIGNPPAKYVSPAGAAWRDITEGFARSWMWTTLAMQDIRVRYRGSILGPFWLTLSTIIMVGAMGAIYARLFNMNAKNYLPFLALGMIVWQVISSMFSDGCQTFIAAKDIIQQVPIPFSIHVYRVVYRNLLIFAHSAVIIPIGIIVFRIPVGWHVLELIPAMILIAINGVWVCTVFGMISTRFGDVPPIVMSFIQILFFVTPIIWPPEALGGLRFIADYNPAFAAIEVFRAPLLGLPVGPYAWPVLIVTTICGSVIGFAFFARFRTRIAYWV